MIADSEESIARHEVHSGFSIVHHKFYGEHHQADHGSLSSSTRVGRDRNQAARKVAVCLGVKLQAQQQNQIQGIHAFIIMRIVPAIDCRTLTKRPGSPHSCPNQAGPLVEGGHCMGVVLDHRSAALSCRPDKDLVSTHFSHYSSQSTLVQRVRLFCGNYRGDKQPQVYKWRKG